MKRLMLLLPAFALTAAVWHAHAWHEQEHYAMTAAAGRLIADDLPDWFVEGLVTDAAHIAIDPDLFKYREAAQLRHAETPEHFFDREYFADEPLPELRYDYYARCYAKGLDPQKVGTLPWAIAEWTQRLQMAFVEHRQRPDDPHIRRKAQVYAGLLAHYAADLAQPLHTTIHWDGRVEEAGDSPPHTGIHMKVDALARKLDVPGETLVDGLDATVYRELWPAILRNFDESFAEVDRLYALADRIPDRDESLEDEEVRQFTLERTRHAIRFVASLYRTAWAQSAEIEPHDWLDREALKAP
jgi:hypothetical protein